MNKLFYFSLICVFTLASCKQSSDKGNLATAADGVKFGEAGTFTIQPDSGLVLTADYYPNEEAKKVIILFHQAGFSRGEYKEIAPRLVKEGFACVAVDLRRGNLANEVFNETSKRAKAQNLPIEYLDAKQDMREAINFVVSHTDKEVYIMGSSYSAGLSLVVGRDERVSKVIAFSPGEYYDSPDYLKLEAPKLNKPAFVTGGVLEYDAVVKPIVDVMISSTTGYKQGNGSDHGCKTLWSNISSSQETWKELLKFLNR